VYLLFVGRLLLDVIAGYYTTELYPKEEDYLAKTTTVHRDLA